LSVVWVVGIGFVELLVLVLTRWESTINVFNEKDRSLRSTVDSMLELDIVDTGVFNLVNEITMHDFGLPASREG
jgi:hypothetical protein